MTPTAPGATPGAAPPAPSIGPELNGTPGDRLARQRGVILVAGAAIWWSSGGAIARMIEADPWTMVFWRSAFAAVALLGFILWRDRGRTIALFRDMGWPGLAVAACFATASTSFVYALALTTVANILIIQSTAPFFAAVLARFLLGERVRLQGWLAIVAALGGVVIMVSDSVQRGSVVGDLLAGLIALSFSSAVVIVRRHHEVRMAPAACMATVFAGLVALPLAAPLAVSASDLGFLALFGAGQLALGMIMFTTGARLIPAAEAALLSVLETILGPIWVWIIFSENPGERTILGGLVVLAALIVHILLDLRRPEKPVPQLS